MRNFNSLPEKTLPPWLSEPSPQGSGKQRAAGLAGSSLLEAARPILRRRRKSLKQHTQTGSKRAALTPVISLGRFWSTPERIASVFPIDGRELADLGLTEAQVLHCETAAFRLILSTV